MTSPLRYNSLLPHSNDSHAAQPPVAVKAYGILSQELFSHALYVERKRTERSGRSFVLMLLESSKLFKPGCEHEALEHVLLALSRASRDTDTRGWYKEGSTVAVIFTELGVDVDGRSVADALLAKITKELVGTLTAGQVNELSLTCHVFPENWANHAPVDEAESGFYDSLLFETSPARMPRLVKRSMDIVGSLLALLFLLPMFLAIAIAIKLTSKGPVLFCQRRFGQYGSNFNFLKFRSMCVNSDATIHREFVQRFINNPKSGNQMSERPSPYKLTADPRVTAIGRFLRKSSLDELPQFLNVLKGDMSLVGPRPPVPYEVECYKVWHRTRLLAAKPGITGLWQVEGRSRVKFDDMVRMDLRYCTSWSLWLDIKILLQTPHAVLSANGAR